MGARSVRKGKDFERKVARALRVIFGAEVRRGAQAREGSDSPDIVLPPAAGLWPECKKGKRP